MPFEFKATRRVEFSDTTSPASSISPGSSNTWRPLSTASSGPLGFSVVMPQFDPPRGFPAFTPPAIIGVRSSLRSSSRCTCSSREKKARSLSYQIRFRRVEPGPVEEVAIGRPVVVCVEKAPEGPMRAVEIPKELADQITVAPAELLEVTAGGGK